MHPPLRSVRLSFSSCYICFAHVRDCPVQRHFISIVIQPTRQPPLARCPRDRRIDARHSQDPGPRCNLKHSACCQAELLSRLPSQRRQTWCTHPITAPLNYKLYPHRALFAPLAGECHLAKPWRGNIEINVQRRRRNRSRRKPTHLSHRSTGTLLRYPMDRCGQQHELCLKLASVLN